MGVVDGKVVRYAGHGGVEGSAAEVFGGDFLACSGFDERRASEENRSLVLDDDGLVAHSGDVGASGGAGAHDYRDLGNTLRAHSGLVEEDPAKVLLIREDVRLVRQVRAAGVHQVYTRELVLLRDCLGAEVFLHRDGVVGSALDGAVVRDDHTVDALDRPDSRDDSSSGNVFTVDVMAGERGELEE